MESRLAADASTPLTISERWKVELALAEKVTQRLKFRQSGIELRRSVVARGRSYLTNHATDHDLLLII